MTTSCVSLRERHRDQFARRIGDALMGTNYYLHEQEPCECCKRPFPELHIGKSSAGWCFSLHVIPEEGINSLTDWIERWSKPGVYIVDEYGQRIDTASMLDTITKRSWKSRHPWTDHDYAMNHAVKGPHGLARHRIGPHCLGHGDTTYDLIPGEFS